MVELGTALRSMAADAQVSPDVDGGDLWSRGRARVRRRRVVGGVVAAVVVAVLAFAGSLVPQPTVTMPAGDPHAPAIPENVYSPNRFLAGVSEEGPPGRLAGIARRAGDEDAGAWFGISATTGEYISLDLPDLATDSPMRLSPDGSRIAYWVTGPTRKDSYGPPDGLNAGGPLPDRPVAGVAVYNTDDGSVERHLVPSDFGLAPKNAPSDLAWLSNDNLAFSYMVHVGSNTTNGGGTFVWAPIGAPPELIEDSEPLEDDAYYPALPGQRSLRVRGDEAVVVDDLGRLTARRLTIGGGESVPDAVSLWGARVVKTGDDRRNPGPTRVFTGLDPGDGARVPLAPVGEIVHPHFLGWLSPTEVLVTARPGELVDGQLQTKVLSDPTEEEVEEAPPAMYAVDLARTTVTRIGDADVASLQVATDILDEPWVHGRRPPSVVNALRVPIGIGVLVLVAAAAGWLGVRRRRRAQG